MHPGISSIAITKPRKKSNLFICSGNRRFGEGRRIVTHKIVMGLPVKFQTGVVRMNSTYAAP